MQIAYRMCNLYAHGGRNGTGIDFPPPVHRRGQGRAQVVHVGAVGEDGVDASGVRAVEGASGHAVGSLACDMRRESAQVP